MAVRAAFGKVPGYVLAIRLQFVATAAHAPSVPLLNQRTLVVAPLRAFGFVAAVGVKAAPPPAVRSSSQSLPQPGLSPSGGAGRIATARAPSGASRSLASAPVATR